jgi:aerobic-type carbon monoxide dehydrogenase small subunit (CoxS/CutS family)
VIGPLERSGPRVALRLSVNGEERALEVPPLRRLLDLLREDLGLTGTKEGCGEGECGACTVLVDGEAALACLVPALHADGREVRTIESRGFEDLQEAFVAHGGAQCGICTPGFVVAAHAWLDARARARTPAPLDDAAAREALAGNLCRCTGYRSIVDSVLAAARARGLPVEEPRP